MLVEQFVSPRTPEAVRRLVEDSFERLRLHCLRRVSSDGYDEYREPLSEQVREVKLHQLKLALKKQARSGSPLLSQAQRVEGANTGPDTRSQRSRLVNSRGIALQT